MSNEESIELRVELPADIGDGVYANAASVWHTPYDFTLDFICIGGPQMQDQDGRQMQPGRVVGRVKIPTQVIFQVAKAIAENVDKYEQRFGPITPAPPGGPGQQESPK